MGDIISILYYAKVFKFQPESGLVNLHVRCVYAKRVGLTAADSKQTVKGFNQEDCMIEFKCHAHKSVLNFEKQQIQILYPFGWKIWILANEEFYVRERVLFSSSLRAKNTKKQQKVERTSPRASPWGHQRSICPDTEQVCKTVTVTRTAPTKMSTSL